LINRRKRSNSQIYVNPNLVVENGGDLLNKSLLNAKFNFPEEGKISPRSVFNATSQKNSPIV